MWPRRKGSSSSNNPQSTGNGFARTGVIALEDFSPVCLLGMGGMGEVWKYLDTQLNRHVAIKFMQPHITQNKEAVQRFYREARTVARLNHPNIVHIYAAAERNGILYFIMELVEGETLSRIIERSGALPLGIALKVLRQTVEGMEYAFSCGVIHRDLKPANLMVTPDATLKITDFGLAKIRTSESNVTHAGNALGSPNYMSPEQAQGKPADHRSDIYSLGITFYQMLAGHVPFHAETPVAILLKQVSEPLPELPFLTQICDGQVLKMIRKMTEKNPDDRYQNYGELKQDIAALGSLGGDLPAFANSIGGMDSLPATPAAPIGGINATSHQGTAGDAELELPPSMGYYATGLGSAQPPVRPSPPQTATAPSAPRAMYFLAAMVSGLIGALVLLGAGGYWLLNHSQLINARVTQPDPTPTDHITPAPPNKFDLSQTTFQQPNDADQPARQIDASASDSASTSVTPIEIPNTRIASTDSSSPATAREIAATTSTAPAGVGAATETSARSVAQDAATTSSTIVANSSASTSNVPAPAAADSPATDTMTVVQAPPAPPPPPAEPLPSEYGVFSMEGKKAVPLEKEPVCQLSLSMDPEFIAFDKLNASSSPNWQIHGMQRDMETGVWAKVDSPTTSCRTQSVANQPEMVRVHASKPLAPGFYCLKGSSKEMYFGVELDQLKRDAIQRANAALKESIVTNEELETIETAAALDAGNTRWSDAWTALSTPRPIPNGPGTLSEIRFSPNGQQLVGFGDAILNWQMPEGIPMASLDPATNGTFAGLAITRDGNSRVVGTLGGKICLWDASTGAKISELDNSKDVKNVFFVGETIVGDLQKPASKKQEKALEVRSWSSDGKFVGAHAIPNCTEGTHFRAAGHSGVVAYTNKQVGHVFDVAAGKFLADIPSGLDVMAIGPAGQYVVRHDGANELELWDPATSGSHVTCEGLHKAPDAAAISPDGKVLVASSANEETGVWDSATGKLIYLYPGGGPVVFSDDGSLFARLLSEQVEICNAQTGKVVRSLTCPRQTCFAFDPNLAWAASAGGSEIRLWRLKGFPNPGDLEGAQALVAASSLIPMEFEKKVAEIPAPKQSHQSRGSGRAQRGYQQQQQAPGMSPGQFVTGLGQTGVFGRDSGNVESVGKTMQLIEQLNTQ